MNKTRENPNVEFSSTQRGDERAMVQRKLRHSTGPSPRKRLSWAGIERNTHATEAGSVQLKPYVGNSKGYAGSAWWEPCLFISNSFQYE